MKYLTIILTFLFCISFGEIAKADSLPNGFRGMEWGTNINSLKNKKDILLVHNKFFSTKDFETEAFNYFDGVTEISGIKIVGPIRLGFYRGKLYSVDLEIGGYDKADSVKSCNSFLRTCYQLYGNPTSTGGLTLITMDDTSKLTSWENGTTRLAVWFHDHDKLFKRNPVGGRENCSTKIELRSVLLSKELDDNYNNRLKEQKKAGW